MKSAYIDSFSGISGDMMVGALIDAGLPLTLIQEALDKLPLEGYTINAGRVKKQGISSTDFSVEVKDVQAGRSYAMIRDMLEEAHLGSRVKALSLRIFEAIAVAEGKVHGVATGDVHFHEVGAVDSIIDIVATAVGIDYLDIHSVYSSHLVTGSGMVMTQHGMMPVPAPATAEILKGIPLAGSTIKGELVTPTGAAIIKVLAKSFGPMPSMKVEKTAYGAGDMDLDERPNLLRIFLGETEEEKAISTLYHEEDEVLLLETSIDDMNPQFYQPMQDDLFESGALDVVMMPVYMKKGRPGTLLQVLAPPDKKSVMAEIIFRDSTAIGIRVQPVGRIKLKRREECITSPLGEIELKLIGKRDGSVEARPEYESLKRVAKENNISIIDAEREVNRLISLQYGRRISDL